MSQKQWQSYKKWDQETTTTSTFSSDEKMPRQNNGMVLDLGNKRLWMCSMQMRSVYLLEVGLNSADVGTVWRYQ